MRKLYGIQLRVPIVQYGFQPPQPLGQLIVIIRSSHGQAQAVLDFGGRKSKNDLSALAANSQTVRPFEQGLWPGAQWQTGSVTVQMTWGEHLSKAGRRWTNRGYSGTEKDDVSYCLAEKDVHVCVGAGARFAYTRGKLVQAKRNQTVRLKI